MNDLDHRQAFVQDQIGARFEAVVGAENVLRDAMQTRAYAHDMLPYANFRAREHALVGTLPALVLRPGSTQDVQDIVTTAVSAGIPLIPYGAGSGVLGGTIPLSGEALIDMRRMDAILSLDEENNLVTVQAGMNGEAFEQALNARGFTAGHLPQSLTISTVGGWAACRGGGQESSRYGKIEDIVVGLKAVLPNGELLEVRPVPKRSTGPSIRDLIVGSEGTLAIITELTLRMWRLPKSEEALVFAFPDEPAALRMARRIMQAGLRPRIVRIYDRKESATRTEGIGAFEARPVLATISLCGEPAVVAAEAQVVSEAASEENAVSAPVDPFETWLANRYTSITKVWQEKGYFNDTIEVTANWSQAAALYDSIAAKVPGICPDAHFSAHWSHVYPEGVCQYMTIRLPPMPQQQALPLHAELWTLLEGETLAHGGSIAHHHGAGLFRGPWMEAEHGKAGMDLLRALKSAVDPDNLFNPGKLGLPMREDAVDPYRDRVRHD